MSEVVSFIIVSNLEVIYHQCHIVLLYLPHLDLLNKCAVIYFEFVWCITGVCCKCSWLIIYTHKLNMQLKLTLAYDSKKLYTFRDYFWSIPQRCWILNSHWSEGVHSFSITWALIVGCKANRRFLLMLKCATKNLIDMVRFSVKRCLFSIFGRSLQFQCFFFF